jgi:putative adenylate-forming enzyme
MRHRTLEKVLIVWSFLLTRYGRIFLSREHLESWQRRRLRKLIRFLKLKSPFYRERLMEPWNVTAPIDKATMMANFDSLNTRGLIRDQALNLALVSEQTRNFSPMIEDITIGLSSGTSGHRGLFCADFFERAAYAGTILAKALPEGGLLKNHRVAFFLRANSNLYKAVGSRKLRFCFFDLLKPLQQHIYDLQKLNPTLLIGPPSLLRQLADQLLEDGLHLPQLVRIFSVAEVLDPVDQTYIEKAFGQKVHQIYQCTEGFLGITCREGFLHLNEDLVIVEKEWIDRENGKFIPIITDLNRRTQPVFRYRLNDILTEDPEPCDCGSVMTRLKMIEGRCDDMLEFPKGSSKRQIFPDFVRNAILFATSDIEEYRVVQGGDGELTVSLKGKGDIQRLEGLVDQQLKLLANRLDCDRPKLKFRHEFPALNGGKLRRIIREMPSSRLP